MSSSKPPNGGDVPPTYDSLYSPSSTKQLSTKQPPTTLTNLRSLIATNRSTPSSPHHALLTTMTRTVHAFLATYSSTTSLSARLSFVSSLPPSATELLAVIPADEFTQTERLALDQYWADEEKARGLATDLKAVLERELGSFEASGETGVLMQVKAEEQTWRIENRFGIYESSTGWAVVVRVRIVME